MNVKECYQSMEADYEDVMRRLVNEERVKKFLGKLLEDRSFLNLTEAMAEGDMERAFQAAHSLKGISLNMGITPLAESSSALTEVLRAREMNEEIAPLFEKTRKNYEDMAAAVRMLLNS